MADENIGSVKISEEVIAGIASTASCEVEGEMCIRDRCKGLSCCGHSLHTAVKQARLQSKHESRSRRTRSACRASSRKEYDVLPCSRISRTRRLQGAASRLRKLCAERGLQICKRKTKIKNRKMTRLTPTVRVVFIIFTTKITKNICARCIWTRTTSVSYTHLDVYKRQHSHSIVPQGFGVMS